MPVTLRRLVADRRFHLRALTVPPDHARGSAVDGADEAEALPGLDRPVLWAHGSDLPDPTPWLEPGQLLLTNGAQFDPAAPSRRAVRSYVRRLVDSGIVALGFAVDVVHDEVPPALVEECERQGLPLLEVGGRTPFIAIVRHVSEVQASESRARLEWSLRAQRSLARAALRPDGLTAVLLELERQLGCWVAMFDAAGHRVPVRTTRQVPATVAARLEASVRDVLARGVRSAARLGDLEDDELEVTLQTLGPRGRLRGVLAVGTSAPLDPAGADLVTSVIALASIALEQSRALDAARRSLRSGLLELLLAGNVEVATATAGRVWGGFTRPPLQVSLVALGPGSEPVLDDLEISAIDSRGRVFYAEHGPDRLLVATAGADTQDVVSLLAHQHERWVGTSAVGGWEDLDRLVEEADRALQRCGPDAPTVDFATMHGEGMLGLLHASGGVQVANRLLAPLRSAPQGDDLTHALRVWTDHNCAWDPAAKALGIHRHTLRHRVTTAGSLLGLDLDTFRGRAELWSALQLQG
jgi:purine catabolism regulator